MVRYKDYAWEKCIISLKITKEYTIDFWFMNMFDFFYFLSYIIFARVYLGIVTDIIDWSNVDFFLYMVLDLIAWKMWWFHNLRNFSRRLLEGELNIHRLRPLNTYFLVTIEQFSGNNLISLSYYFTFVLGLILYLGYSNLFLAFLLMVFGWVYFVCFMNFMNSFAFFVKNMESFMAFPAGAESMVKRFTPKFYENFSLFTLLAMFPITVHGFLVIELLKGRYDFFLMLYPYILATFAFFIVGIYVLWRYGLKKYEAFG